METKPSHFFEFRQYGFLLFGGGVVVCLIILLKAKTGVSFVLDPFLFSYSIFVTTFELSRIFGAMMYRRPSDALISKIVEAYEPRITFIIPCKNEEENISRTLARCCEVEYPKEKLEVIVINDGSKDHTLAQILRAKRTKEKDGVIINVVNWRKNRGKRHAMAEGFKKASGEIVIQLDSDSSIDAATFRKLIAPFQDSRIGAVSAHTEPENADQNLITKMQAAYYFISFRILKAAESTFFNVFCCSGCASAYRKSVVLPILKKWVNEKFLGKPVTWGDDRALTNWVLRSNYRTVYTDEVKAYTIVPDTLKKFLHQQIRWKKGWFVNSLFASTFIWKKDPFVAFTYFFPLVFITLSTPVMAAKAFVYNPLVRDITPALYIVGVLLVACLLALYYRFVARTTIYWPYIFVWSCINMLLLSFILFYALFRLRDRGWGTR